jgi:beta-barrel assembly-enhancing protease
MTNGIYLDGRTAARHKVQVELSIDPSGSKLLHITGDGIDLVWPVRSVRRTPPHSGQEARLQLASSDARLLVALADAGPLLAGAPELFRRPAISSPVALVASLALVAAAVVGATFFLAPMLAGPIARATPVSVETSYGLTSRQIMDLSTEACDLAPDTRADTDRLAADLVRVSGSPFPPDLRFVRAGFPNAFAMPGGRIMVTAELIAQLETPDELAGVLAHEMAHVARRHVMAAVVRELGGAVIFDLLVGGGSGAGQQIAMAGLQLQNLSHGRAAEAEADTLAVQYLSALDIDPGGLADFFARIREMEADAGNGSSQRETGRLLELLSTHPLTQDRETRARALAAEAGSPASPRPALKAETWASLKSDCSDPE